MKNKYLLFGLIFIIGALFGHSLNFLNAFTDAIDYPPSNNQSNFARTCSELIGKELSLQNVEQLGGWSFVNGGLAKPQEENIKRLNSGTDPFFNVYHKKQYDNTWVCGIGKTEDGKIKAWTYYQYE